MNDRKNVTLLALLMLVTSLNGCSSMPVENSAPTSAELRQIATDFTSVMIQLASLKPADKPLLWSEVSQFAGPFSSVLKTGLSAAGYELLLSDDRDDEYAVGFFRVEDAYSDDGISGTYIVSVGDRQFQRSYRILVDGSLVATSDMLVRGADMSGVRLDQSELQTVMPVDTLNVAPENDEPPASDNKSLYAGIQNLAGEPSSSEPFLNLFNVHEEILRFDSESTILSRQGRALLRIVVNRFNPESDVVLLVGCSQGESEAENGNATLATDRTQAASLELQGYGVPERNIFEAGCWATEDLDPRFPKAGLVVTLKREVKDPGLRAE